MFVGRTHEIELLNEMYNSDKSELVVLYGRRRVGKSSLVRKFAERKTCFYVFEAVEGESTPSQIRHFTEQLKRQTQDPVLESVNFQTWDMVFSYLTDRIVNQPGKKKRILFFDEIQWMAVGRSKLISLLKFYWDIHWKAKPVLLILCGSLASFMIKKVLRSKALYGRTTLEIHLKGLLADEAKLLFRRKRSKEEILKYLLIFGGIPKYLEEISLNRSFNQNINRLCFSGHSTMIHEPDRIFYSHFRETKTYMRIVSLLKKGLYSLGEISHKLNIPSGGGLKLYLDNLEQAEIITSFTPYDRGNTSKFRKYMLSDEFLIFYFKYIEPNLGIINESQSGKLFEKLTRDSFAPWMGFAFERFCRKHSMLLAAIMGFDDEVLLASPHFEKRDIRFQIDLLYKRADSVITVCEVKYHNTLVGTRIIPEMERKCLLLKTPRGYTLEKALISLYGPDKSLKDTEYFNHYVTIDDLM